MGTPVTFNGLSVVVPEVNDQGWGSDVSALLIQLANFAATSTSLVQSSRIVTTTPQSLLTSDFSIAVNVPSASVINLPAGSGTTGVCYLIYDYSGAASTNPITITPVGLDTINGAANYVINKNNGSVLLQYTGTQWSIIATAFIPAPGTVSYSQSTVNPSYVSSPTTTSVGIATVNNLKRSQSNFIGNYHFLFTVSLTLTGDTLLCSCSYLSPNITCLNDSSGLFNPNLTGTGISITKNLDLIIIQNRTGISQKIEIKSLTTDIQFVTNWV